MKAGNGDIDIQKEFTAEQLAKLDDIIKKSKDKPGALIPVLEEAQMVLEFLPMPILQIIAKGLNLPLSRVYGVVTFYSFFTMTPRGKHTLRVCLGTACYVRGGKSIMESIQKELGVKEKETTSGQALFAGVSQMPWCLRIGPGHSHHGRRPWQDENAKSQGYTESIPRRNGISLTNFSDEGKSYGKTHDSRFKEDQG